MMFYLRLARTNLRANARIFLPFMLAVSFLAAVNVVILNSYYASPTLFAEFGAKTAQQLFVLGSIVIFLMSVILAWYANGFLLKQRTRQLAVYNLIGFGRRELTQMLLAEQLVCFGVSLVLGLISGVAFARLGYLGLARLLNLASTSGFGLNGYALLFAVIELIVIFLLLALRDMTWVLRHRPLALLQAAKAGEREPKTRWLWALIGVVTLASGYYLALTITNPIKALFSFFIAVILVVVGTFALFIVGSVFILKWLRRRPRYYYQPQHFINVSNMLYRMKQNGAGLAAITILITMTMLTIGTTVTLFIGIDGMVKTEAPTDLAVTYSVRSDQQGQLAGIIEKTAAASGITAHAASGQQTLYSDGTALRQTAHGYRLATDSEQEGSAAASNQGRLLSFMTAKAYRIATGRALSLRADQVLLVDPAGYQGATVSIGYHGPRGQAEQQTWQVAGVIRHIPNQVFQLPRALVVVVRDTKVLRPYLGKTVGDFGYTTYYYNLTGTDKQQAAMATRLTKALKVTHYGIQVVSRAQSKNSLLQIMGSFLFMGILLGLTFLLATALILYYKQVAEGLADTDRYAVLQRVGLSLSEVRRTINSQLLMLFYLPLVVAGCHAAAATRFIQQILVGFGLADWRLYVGLITLTFIVFGLVYVLLYKLTSRVYFRLVARGGSRR